MKQTILLLVVVALGSSACKKLGPYEKIDGTWKITSSEIFGTSIPGDGSTISFVECDTPPCPGSDYLASDGTTSNITYEFLNDDDILAIVDTTGNGGSYNAEWDVGTFTKSRLTLSADAGFFGPFKMTLEKE